MMSDGNGRVVGHDKGCEDYGTMPAYEDMESFKAVLRSLGAFQLHGVQYLFVMGRLILLYVWEAYAFDDFWCWGGVFS